jgi:hypothetical protein
MAANYVLLEKISVGAAGASSVTFSGIPQTGYTDLVVKWSIRANSGGATNTIGVTFNGSSSNLSGILLYGTGSATGSQTQTTIGVDGNANGATANTFSNQEMYIPNYTSSNFKSVSTDSVQENNSSTAFAELLAGLWSSTAAITSITLTPGASALFNQYSTFYLYGVAKLGTTPAIVPYATGGDTIMTDGTYWYHTFLSSGTFTPAKGLSCDVLVVAGGGGSGGSDSNDKGSGGGGAGGLLAHTSQSLTATGYTVTIGAGGTGGIGGTPGTATAGNNGSDSQFASLTASVGGGGGGGGRSANGPGIPWNGKNGGSGGGSVKAGTAGTGTAGQGNAGGTASITSDSGAGGGGAGAVGASITADPGGAGGAGVNTYSTWLNTTGTGVSGFIAGGGGGGAYSGAASTGGSGGGGAGGAATAQGSAGVANTGGGAGGTGGNTTAHSGNAGGSGIVIVRYAV